jgi:hypothetical protein
VLYTHHFRREEPTTGNIAGAGSDLQVSRAGEPVEAAGQGFTYPSFPDMPHSTHEADPQLYAKTVLDWASGLALG